VNYMGKGSEKVVLARHKWESRLDGVFQRSALNGESSCDETVQQGNPCLVNVAR